MQIQGQLRVSKMKKAYFAGYISPTEDLTVVEIERDEVFIVYELTKIECYPEIVLRFHRATCAEAEPYQGRSGRITPLKVTCLAHSLSPRGMAPHLPPAN